MQHIEAAEAGGVGALTCVDGDYPKTKGTMSYEGHTGSFRPQECIGNPSVPAAILELAVAKYYRGKNCVLNKTTVVDCYPHDYIDRTGHDVAGSIYTKSIPFDFDNTYNVQIPTGEDRCTLRGYVTQKHGEPFFQEVEWNNTVYPNILTSRENAGNLFGPAVFPKAKTVDVSSTICKNKKCCIAEKTVYPPTQTFAGFARVAATVHYLCAPVYYPEQLNDSICFTDTLYGKRYTPCGYNSIDYGTVAFMKSCNCLAIQHDKEKSFNQVKRYGGLGIDCSSILPGGKYEHWDVYMKKSWALNEMYKISNKCGEWSENTIVSGVQKCDGSKGKCEIPFNENMSLAFGSPIGDAYTLLNWGGRW